VFDTIWSFWSNFLYGDKIMDKMLVRRVTLLSFVSFTSSTAASLGPSHLHSEAPASRWCRCRWCHNT